MPETAKTLFQRGNHSEREAGGGGCTTQVQGAGVHSMDVEKVVFCFVLMKMAAGLFS